MPDRTGGAAPSTASDDFQVVIRNCNSIVEAEVSLRPYALNIKYGPNGLGKSTIARALTLCAESDGSMDQLTPFEFRGIDNAPQPAVSGAESIQSVMTFNESYVSQFAFQQEEVLKDSFEIFINTPEYKDGLRRIDSLFQALKEHFIEQSDFNDALKDFNDLRDSFNVTKAGDIAKNSKGYKALGVAGKLTTIPKPLLGFRDFIEGSDPAGWVTWQSKGKTYLETSDNCPFCSAREVNKETVLLVSSEYESSAVRNMTALRGVLERLGRYLAPGHRQQLQTITSAVLEPGDEQIQFLRSLRGDIETFLRKLLAVRSLSFHSLRGDADVSTSLTQLKIDLGSLPSLKSDSTSTVVDMINSELASVASRVNDIRRHIGQLNTRVSRLIKDNQDSINSFLQSAGYKYSVRIEARDDSYRMLLDHKDSVGHVQLPSDHLSYGEKNAFALVLFMHHARSVQPDLVILDDPVSSFDATKKFAVLHQLFSGRDSLRGLTSLLLTHDIEPAIDIVRTGTSRKFHAAKPLVHFLRSRRGIIEEAVVEAVDIATFTQVCAENIKSALDPIVKCIYLRRKLEMEGSKGLEYQLLSSLLHVRSSPTVKLAYDNDREMTQQEQDEAAARIRASIPGFDYTALLGMVTSSEDVRRRFENTEVGYEKLQLFRILAERHPELARGDDVLDKFVNGAFHIENEYVMQLNPQKFDAVPEYVIEACQRAAERLG